MAKDPIRVLVTGAAGQIAYSLLYPIAHGDVFGKDQPIILVMLDIEQMKRAMEGVTMELTDSVLPLLKEVIATTDVAEAFKDIDVAILVGAMPRRQGMERKDLLKANVRIFKQQGEAIDKFAKKSVKVLVVGNPANTNCFICKKYAPSIDPKNFSALTRLDQNRAQAKIAERLKLACNTVQNVIIWGNHSSTQFPDPWHATVLPAKKDVVACIQNDDWLKNEFVKEIQVRGAAVIQARGLSSAMSAAKAICDHLHDWWHGTESGRFVSMAVVADGSYGVENGLIYSFPVTIKDGQWSIVQGLEVSDFARGKMDATMAELKEERDAALEVCQG